MKGGRRIERKGGEVNEGRRGRCGRIEGGGVNEGGRGKGWKDRRRRGE